MAGEHSAARRVLEVAAAAGVETAFGLPGVHNLAFWREECPPGVVVVRHEQTAVYAADGLARATGRPGLALTTTGPGAANAVAAFGEAAASRSPVVLLASEVPSTLARPGELRGLLHESRDQAGLFEPLAKAVLRPRSAGEAVAAASEAFDAAMAWPRGPVYLDVPADLLAEPAPPGHVARPVRPEPDGSRLREAARLLGDARGVVVWAGGGVAQSGAETALAAVAEAMDAPVVVTYAARGTLPPDHPLLVGLPPHEPEVADLIASADAMLAVGTDFDGMMTRNWRMPMPPALVEINCSEDALGRAFDPDVAVAGDARLALEELRRLLAGLAGEGTGGAASRGAQTGGAASRGAQHGGAAQVRACRERAWKRLRADEADAAALAFLASVEAALPPDGVVVCDMAIPGYWAGGYLRVRRPRGLQYPVGWGTLGYALPAAVGASSSGRPALAVCGDGGVMMGIGELATLAQEGLPATVLVVDDGGYGMLRYDQDRAGDPHRGVDLLAPDFVDLARSFGVAATAVDDPGEPLRVALADALASGEPRLVTLEARMRPPRTTSPRWFDPR